MNVVPHFADEVFRVFPEVKRLCSEGDQQLPYVLMANLVAFLEKQADPALPLETLRRVREFNLWCQNQPRGEDAGRDVLTIVAVGLFEKVLTSDKLHYLVPTMILRADFISSRDYLVSWAGEENYRRALALY
jgi:hypothetical protein